jgi:N-acetylglucosamine-6-sulfatase
MKTIRRAGSARALRSVGLIAVLGACVWSGLAAPGQPALVASAQSVAGPPRPNILFILTDDQDVGSLRFMPKVQVLLAAQGLTSPNTFAVQPLCCPSRASILRGQYPHNTQIVHNAPPVGGFPKFRDLGHETSTLATWLQTAGYRTAFFGKYLNGYPTADRPEHVPPGWDEWYGAHEGPVRYYNYRMTENGRVVSYGARPEDYRTDVLTGKAVSFIEARPRNASPPFFIYFSVPAPHADRPGDGPAIPARRHLGALGDVSAPRPPSFNEADVDDKPTEIRQRPMLTDGQVAEIDEEYRTRVESLLAVDEAVERLVGALSARGELANTYIVFTSDNGYHLGEHRIPRGKNTLYEESIRLPGIVRGPGVPAGLTREHFVLNIDFAPTFADLAGASIPDFVDGRSFASLLRGSPTPVNQWRRDFLLEVTSPMGVTDRGLRTRDYAFFRFANGETSLFDLRQDPYQVDSVHRSVDPQILQALTARLSELANCRGQTCRN